MQLASHSRPVCGAQADTILLASNYEARFTILPRSQTATIQPCFQTTLRHGLTEPRTYNALDCCGLFICTLQVVNQQIPAQ